MSALIDTETRQLRAQLLGAMVCRQTGEPAPQRFHLRRSVEPEEPAERRRVAFFKMLGPLDSLPALWWPRRLCCKRSRG
jgi:hypothetical protein